MIESERVFVAWFIYQYAGDIPAATIEQKKGMPMAELFVYNIKKRRHF